MSAIDTLQPAYEIKADDANADVANVPTKGEDVYVRAAIVEQSHIIPMSGERKITTRWEYWTYCLCYIGINGVGGYNFGPTQYQNLLVQQFPDGFMQWGGSLKSVNSVILDVNGLTFAIQTVIFLTLGPYADYGTWRPWILIGFTVMSWAAGFAWLGVTDPAKWQAATCLYVLGYLGYNLTFAFYSAAFPGLVRDLPKMIASEAEVIEGTMAPEEYDQLNMLERSKLVNLSLIFSSVGTTALLAISLGIPKGLGYETTEQNTKVFSVLIAFFTGAWILFSTPWFIAEQRRPGQKLPQGSNYLTVGPKQIWQAAKCAWKLKHTLLYIAAFFLVNDVLNTSYTVTGLLLNEVIAFDTFTTIALLMEVFGGQIVGVWLMHTLQQRLKWQAKWLLMLCCTCIWATCLWGLIGLWTDKIGYHNKWEFYLYQAWNGVAVGGWYSYSNAMISEVVPAPKMYMFFALFNIVGKASAFVGPFITSAIIDDAGGNTSSGFWFLTFSGLVGLVLLALVNPTQAKIDCARYLEIEAAALYTAEEVEDFHMAQPPAFTGRG